ncbi:hypothetical protein OPV22_000573 [Ensete ventricosum]|uniref:Uncharacterized protein n=1 Tax=Ensete ventricosum TaxID=4639 RepID=A0AAV8RJD9_ENSVE|nr:hypothetical protein OPV22_000573 [Ensete ventricosum]
MFFMLAISLRWSLMCRPKCLADTDFRQPSSEFLVQKDRVLILPALAAMMLVWMEFPPWVREDQTGSHFKIPTQRQPVYNYPITLWINGGPGCVGLDARLRLIGPFKLEPDLVHSNGQPEVKKNPYPWTKDVLCYIVIEKFHATPTILVMKSKS